MTKHEVRIKKLVEPGFYVLILSSVLHIMILVYWNALLGAVRAELLTAFMLYME